MSEKTETDTQRVLRECWEATHVVIDGVVHYRPAEWQNGHADGVAEERDKWSKAIKEEFERVGYHDDADASLRRIMDRMGVES